MFAWDAYGNQIGQSVTLWGGEWLHKITCLRILYCDCSPVEKSCHENYGGLSGDRVVHCIGRYHQMALYIAYVIESGT